MKPPANENRRDAQRHTQRHTQTIDLLELLSQPLVLGGQQPLPSLYALQHRADAATAHTVSAACVYACVYGCVYGSSTVLTLPLHTR